MNTAAVLTPAEVRADSRIGSPHEEIARAYGPDLGAVVSAVYGRGRTLAVAMLMYMLAATLLLALVLGREQRVDLVLAVVLGVVANAVTQAVFWSLMRLKRGG